MSDVSKISVTTRNLVERASVARNVLIADLKVRYATCEMQSDVDTDILVRRISLALKAIHDEKAAASTRMGASTYDEKAAVIIGKKGWTKTVVIDDNTRTKAEQDIYGAANKWLLRARQDAGVKSEEARGGTRKPRTPTLVNAIVAEGAPKVASEGTPIASAQEAAELIQRTASEPTFSVAIPKPKRTNELGQAIAMLATAAIKLMGDAAQTKALDGALGLHARNALAAIIEAGRAFDAHRNAHELALIAKEKDAPKGALRAAAIAAVKAGEKHHPAPKPIVEIADGGEVTAH